MINFTGGRVKQTAIAMHHALAVVRLASAVTAIYSAASLAGAAAAAESAGWQTTVLYASPPLVRDPSWATTVASNTPARLAALLPPPASTGSIARAEPIRPAAGPRLTGKSHATAGLASFYSEGQMTATGERFDRRALTAAHRTLPFGTRVRVTRADTKESVVVRINDRGPFREGRVIDLSERAAEVLGMTGRGTAPVRLEVLGR